MPPMRSSRARCCPKTPRSCIRRSRPWPRPPPEQRPRPMDPTELSHHAATLGQDAHGLADQSRNLADHLDSLAQQIAVQAQYAGHGGSNFTFFLTVFVLACFVGYY